MSSYFTGDWFADNYIMTDILSTKGDSLNRVPEIMKKGVIADHGAAVQAIVANPDNFLKASSKDFNAGKDILLRTAATDPKDVPANFKQGLFQLVNNKKIMNRIKVEDPEGYKTLLDGVAKQTTAFLSPNGHLNMKIADVLRNSAIKGITKQDIYINGKGGIYTLTPTNRVREIIVEKQKTIYPDRDPKSQQEIMGQSMDASNQITKVDDTSLDDRRAKRGAEIDLVHNQLNKAEGFVFDDLIKTLITFNGGDVEAAIATVINKLGIGIDAGKAAS